jgi:hypothetical protein
MILYVPAFSPEAGKIRGESDFRISGQAGTDWRESRDIKAW